MKSLKLIEFIFSWIKTKLLSYFDLTPHKTLTEVSSLTAETFVTKYNFPKSLDPHSLIPNFFLYLFLALGDILKKL